MACEFTLKTDRAPGVDVLVRFEDLGRSPFGDKWLSRLSWFDAEQRRQRSLVSAYEISRLEDGGANQVERQNCDAAVLRAEGFIVPENFGGVEIREIA